MVKKTNRIKIVENENTLNRNNNLVSAKKVDLFDKNDALGDEVELGEASQAS